MRRAPSPWRTERRASLRAEARTFARDVVLPAADELDRQKTEMPCVERGDG